MDLRKFWAGLEKEKRESLAVRAGTTVGYLKLVFGGHQKPGASLALRLEDSILTLELARADEITKAHFRPDIWDQIQSGDDDRTHTDRVPTGGGGNMDSSASPEAKDVA